MTKSVTERKTFEKIDYSKNQPDQSEYENCAFTSCTFSGVNLSNIRFSECSFTGCNLSMAKLGKTVLRDIKFQACKLLGLHFDECSQLLFTVAFENCILNLSSFYKVNLKKTRFAGCSLKEVDFTETDLTGAIFDNCDLLKAKFDRTILMKADLRTSYNYSIDPERNRIKKAKLSLPGVIGLLDKYDIEIG